MKFDITLFFLSLITLVTGLLVTKLITRINILDIPNQRSSHSTPTPKGGGIGIIAAWLVFITGYYFLYHPEIDTKVIIIVISSLIMGAQGLGDDLVNISFKFRLLFQIVISSIVVLMGLKLRSLAFPYFGEIILSPTSSFLLSVLWLTAFTNAFNFIDGLNGLSAMAAIVVCAFIFYIFNDPISLLMLGLCMGAIGFLRYNFGEAKIFMSEVGSQFIGFFIACCALALPYYNNDAAFLVIPFIFFIYIFDTFITILRRLVMRKNIFEPHRMHLFQLLNRMGWSHKKVALFYAGTSFIAGLVSFKMIALLPYLQMYFFLGYLILCSIYCVIVISLAEKRGIKI